MADVAYVSLSVDVLLRVLADVFRAIGCPPPEADVMAEELVTADRMGLGSHGSSRAGEYVEIAESGRVRPGGVCTVARETSGTALVDGGMNYGQVAGRFALDVGARKAREVGVACVVTRRCHHIARLGSLMERAADQELIAIATIAVNVPGSVAPWGAVEGVLGTNPIAYGLPLGERPVVADFATSTMAEGAVRLAHQTGRKLPAAMIIDAAGEPSTDPGELFTKPRGALLPFGGAVGYKGYALNLLAELTAAPLAGYGGVDPERPSNCLLLILVDPSAFGPLEAFREHAAASVALVRGARRRPGQSVLLPGEREIDELARHSTVVEVPERTLAEIRTMATRFSIDTDGLVVVSD